MHLKTKVIFLALIFFQNIFAHDVPEAIDLSKLQWEYRWGDIFPDQKKEGWETIDFPSNPPNRNSRTNVWYRIKLPGILPKDPTLYIFSIDLITEVYFKNEKIYSFGTFDTNAKGTFEGWPWHMIKIPEDAQGEYLYFRIYSNYPDIGLWGEITLASKGYILENMLNQDLLKLTVGAVTGFIGILFIILLISRLKIEFFLVGSLFLTQGIDLLLSTKIVQLYFNFPLLKQYILAFCYFFVPVGMAALLEYFIGAGFLKIIRRIWQIHLLYILVAFGSALLGFSNVSSLYIYYDNLYYFFTLPILTVIILNTMFKGDYEAKILSFGFFIISLSGLHSSLIAWGFVSWQEHPSYIAVLICLSIFAYAVVRKVMFTEKIQKQKEEFESIFKYSKDGIAITDLKLNFLDFNDAYLKMTEYTKDELLKSSCTKIGAPEYRQKSAEIINKVLEQGFVENFERTSITKTGQRVDENMTISLLPDKKRLLLVTKDVTSLKHIEQQSKLASMGEMIGNIAHQWRQPLNVITTSVSGLSMKCELGTLDNKEIIKLSSLVLQQARYLSNTIDNFRNFIKSDVTYKEISVVDALNNSLDLTNAAMKDAYINVISHIEDDITILGNANELSQAFINIFNNSKDQLRENVEREDERLLITSTKKLNNNKLEITIKDSGGGVDENIIERIFEPYFSTKHQSVGTGLGLSMANKIIRERHHGEISVHNETFEHNDRQYCGACFSIIFNDPR